MKILINKEELTKLIECDPTIPLSNLKPQIMKELKTDKNFILLHKGRVLQDEKTLNDYGIEELSTIFLHRVEKQPSSNAQSITKLPQGWNCIEEVQNVCMEHVFGVNYFTSGFEFGFPGKNIEK